MSRSVRTVFSPLLSIDGDGDDAPEETFDLEGADDHLHDSEDAAELGLASSSTSSGRTCRVVVPLGRIFFLASASLVLGLLVSASLVGLRGAQERRHRSRGSTGGVVGFDSSSSLSASSSVTPDKLVSDAFPGELHHWFTKWSPMFAGASLHEEFNCAKPYPSIYFGNLREASYPLFHNHSETFPMAMNYMDSSEFAKPPPGVKQTVLGFADMQWAYYHYNGDLRTTSPYLVISMNPFNYTPKLNFQFVECGLLGWPGFPQLAGGDYPLRLVLKNPTQGRQCSDFETGHAWCNLETSWGMHPEVNNWRPTAMEVNALVQLCKHKYSCDIQKANLEAAELGKEVPQVYLFRVLRDANGNPLPPPEPRPNDGHEHSVDEPPQAATAAPTTSSFAPTTSFAPTEEAPAEAPPPPSVPLPAAAAAAAASTEVPHDCQSVCEFEGWTGTCELYTQWAAKQHQKTDVNACVEGYVTMLEICPNCWGCSLAEAECTQGEPESEQTLSPVQEEETEFATLAQGCDTLCKHDGWLATCSTRVQFAATHLFADEVEPCADALKMVHVQCPACGTQCKEVADTTCSLQVADQWTALMLRTEVEEAQPTTPVPEYVQAVDTFAK